MPEIKITIEIENKKLEIKVDKQLAENGQNGSAHYIGCEVFQFLVDFGEELGLENTAGC